MDSFEKIERRREARSRICAQRERAGRLKTRVVAISLICFALLWGVVFVQMATGHDPVLGNSAKPAQRGGGNSRVARAEPPQETEVGSAREPAESEEEALAREEEEFAAEVAAEEAAELEVEPVEVEPVEEEFVEEEPAPVTTSQS